MTDRDQTTSMTAYDSAERAEIQRRVLRALMGSVIPTSAALTAVVAATAVLAEEITDSETLAGVAAGSLSVGAVASAIPLARMMSRRGRRTGLAAGWLIGAVGALLVFVASVVELYPLLMAGILVIGAGQSANLATRYAAADLATEERRGRAIGLLVWATTFGAVSGPAVALGPAGSLVELMGLPNLSGPFLLSLVMFFIGAVITYLNLRPDPLEVLGTVRSSEGWLDRKRQATPGHPSTQRHPSTQGQLSTPKRRSIPGVPTATPLRTVAERIATVPAARLAVLAMLTGQAVMVGIMTMTPLHMKSGAHQLSVIGLVISLHIIGMYAFSPIVGWLVDRLGPHLVIALGGITLFVGSEMASRTSAADSLGIFIGLLLIGLGWSFGLISGSSLLTSAFPAHQRVEVQGAADMMMTLGGAVSGLLAGVTVETVGYRSFSHWAGLTALILVAAAGAAWYAERRPMRLQPR